MAWQNPKTNWKAGDVPSSDDFNRIENNIEHVKNELGNIELNAENVVLESSKFSSNNVKDGMEELFTSVSDGKQKIAAAITDMGQSASGSDTFEQLSDKIKDISKDANAATNHVLSGKTFYQGGSKKTGTMPNRGAVTNTITTQGGSYTIPAGYHSGSGKVTANFANLVPENIKSGVNIGGVVGTLQPLNVISGYLSFTYEGGYGTTLTKTISHPIKPKAIFFKANYKSSTEPYNKNAYQSMYDDIPTWIGYYSDGTFYSSKSGASYAALYKVTVTNTTTTVVGTNQISDEYMVDTVYYALIY